ncbi:MAG TPA: hypothetical protein VFA70_14030 [Dehalococcoidia bacterium]|nr:hypothetical protein [Dehalococcoidia bacterium]
MPNPAAKRTIRRTSEFENIVVSFILKTATIARQRLAALACVRFALATATLVEGARATAAAQ